MHGCRAEIPACHDCRLPIYHQMQGAWQDRGCEGEAIAFSYARKEFGNELAEC